MTDHNYQNGIYEQQTASDYDGMQHSRSQIQPDHPAMISVDAYPAPSHGNDYDMHNLVPTNNEFDWNTHDSVYERSAAQFFMNLPSKPASSQSEIVQLRSDRVNEQYGNLTPPEEDAMRDVREDNNPQLKQAGSATDNPKRALDRSERARNAANQRHAKSKRRALKEDQNSDSDPEDSSNDGDDRREKYREKNRAAAAKCRAKKKTHVDKIELDARSLETENAMLKARVRELRNQHAELRDLALQHNPSVANCRCGSLHQYNIGKAAEITSSFNAYASMRSDSLVPQDALHEINLKDRILSNARATYGSMTLDPQAFAGASSFAFAGVNTPQSMQMRSTAEMDDQHQQSSGSARSSARRNLC